MGAGEGSAGKVVGPGSWSATDWAPPGSREVAPEAIETTGNDGACHRRPSGGASGSHRYSEMAANPLMALAAKNEHSSECAWKSLANQSVLATGASTTLADLLTPLFVANPFSAVRASFLRQSSDERDDGVADGRQTGLRRRSIDSFFPASLI